MILRKMIPILVILALAASALTQQKNQTRLTPLEIEKQQWDALTVTEKHKKLEYLLSMSESLASEQGADYLIATFLSGYPFQGIGIEYGLSYREIGNDRTAVNVKINGIWKNSPAERIGLRVGDLVRGVEWGTERKIFNAMIIETKNKAETKQEKGNEQLDSFLFDVRDIIANATGSLRLIVGRYQGDELLIFGEEWIEKKSSVVRSSPI